MSHAAARQNPYTVSDTVVRSERSVEYQAFAKVTAALAKASKNKGDDLSQLAEALHENRRLWNILAADALGEGNKLPAELRAGIVSLSTFVSTHSASVLQGSADLETLLDINKAVMRGLSNG